MLPKSVSMCLEWCQICISTTRQILYLMVNLWDSVGKMLIIFFLFLCFPAAVYCIVFFYWSCSLFYTVFLEFIFKCAHFSSVCLSMMLYCFWIRRRLDCSEGFQCSAVINKLICLCCRNGCVIVSFLWGILLFDR